MSELIDRAALTAKLEMERGVFASRNNMHDIAVSAGMSEAMRIVKSAPSVAAAPVVHARWEKIVIREETRYREEISHFSCSRCKSGNSDFLPRYCSNCGARMDADAPERAEGSGQ